MSHQLPMDRLPDTCPLGLPRSESQGHPWKTSSPRKDRDYVPWFLRVSICLNRSIGHYALERYPYPVATPLLTASLSFFCPARFSARPQLPSPPRNLPGMVCVNPQASLSGPKSWHPGGCRQGREWLWLTWPGIIGKMAGALKMSRTSKAG